MNTGRSAASGNLQSRATSAHAGRVNWIWCDGEFRDGPLVVLPDDRGLTNGLGIFETLLALDGQPVALDLHMARLRSGAARLRWETADLTCSRMESAITALLIRCGLTAGRARVRVAMTGGAGELPRLEQGTGALLWITAAMCPPPPPWMSLVTSPFPRNEKSPLSGIKCASYAENLIALDHARRAGADEALFFNTRSELCEAATANVFIVRDGEVLTPPLSSGCLPGTMRERVLGKCSELRIPARESHLTAADLATADEIFLTSATRGIVPVVELDGCAVPAGRIAERLRAE
jgi:branched-chain amino acid aminotransferase